MRLDLPGVLLFVVVLASVSGLVLAPPSDLAAATRPLTTYRATTEAPVTFVLLADGGSVKVIVLGEALPTPVLAWDQPFLVQARWLGDADQSLGALDVPLSAVPAVQAPWPPEASPELLAPRAIVLARPEGAVGLQLSPPPGSPALRLRAFQDREGTLADDELAMMRIDEKDAALVVRELGLTGWADATTEEVALATAAPWRALYPRQSDLAEDALRVSRVPTEPLSGPALSAADTALAPGAVQTWRMVGPGAGTLVWRPADAPAPRVHWVVADRGIVPPGGAPVPGAWSLEAPVGAATLTAVATAPLERLWWTVPTPAHIAPEEQAVPLTRLTGDDADTDWLVAPSRIRIARPTARPGAPVRWALPPVGAPTLVRLDLRPTEATSVRVTVQGAEQAVHTFDLPVDIEPGARRIGTGDRMLPIGASATRHLRLPPGATDIAIEPSHGALLVEVRVEGPEAGRHDAWDATRTTTLRYAFDSRSTWLPLEPQPSETTRIEVLRQREVIDPPDAHRTFETVDAEARRGVVPGELWLVPPDPTRPLQGVLYCPVPAGAASAVSWDVASAARLDGILSVLIWAPEPRGRPQLGDAWTLRLDGLAWRQGRFDSRVTTVAGTRSPSSRARLDAPDGATAWLRTTHPCPDGMRPRRIVRANPSSPARFLVTADGTPRLLVVGGTGPGPASLAVTVSPARGATRDLAVEHTPRLRVLTLEPRADGGIAIDASLPDRRQPALGTAGLMLYDDLVGAVLVEVRPLEDDVGVFLLAERRGGTRDGADVIRVAP